MVLTKAISQMWVLYMGLQILFPNLRILCDIAQTITFNLCDIARVQYRTIWVELEKEFRALYTITTFGI